jgi:hypothetical protein
VDSRMGGDVAKLNLLGVDRRHDKKHDPPPRHGGTEKA